MGNHGGECDCGGDGDVHDVGDGDSVPCLQQPFQHPLAAVAALESWQSAWHRRGSQWRLR